MKTLIIVLLITGYYSFAQGLAENVRASSTNPSRATTKGGSTTGKPGPTPSTTTTPRSLSCYFCGGTKPCPQPFTPSSRNVQIVTSNNGFCEKMSPYNGGQGPFSRGSAIPGHCSSNGCTRKLINNQWTEVCCCSRNYCNTGITSFRSAWKLLLASLAVLSFFYTL